MFKRVLIFCLVLILNTPAASGRELLLFAAASLKEAMDRATGSYMAATGRNITISYAASSVLARQIAAGAPADLFISASADWMDWLAERQFLRHGARRIVAGNELVILTTGAPSDTNPAALLAARFAMGDPSHVPAGQYAHAALTALGLWDTVKERAVFGENVRVALELVDRGEVSAAIVYRSDGVATRNKLATAYAFPANLHAPIVYSAAPTRHGNANAEDFIDFLVTEKGQSIFAELGFLPPPGEDGP